jgi:RNase P subunit RPR2
MTMTDLVASRASYLQEAAHLLAVSSPTASAFLGSARNRLVEETESEIATKERDALRRETCGACGNVFIPGWSCEVSNKPKTQQKSHKAKSMGNTADFPTTTIYDCLRCGRQTEQTLQTKARRQLKKSKTPVAIQSSITTSIRMKEDDSKTPKTANASSKQRQRTRKGGLQAMLEKNKSQKASQDLDLMDFMM